jgi:hypothetical protein
MDEKLRQRAKNSLLRVTFPDGKIICHKNATMTFVEALKEIGPENFEMITIENCHLPLLSKDIYPNFARWMKPVCDGWFVNAQSDTAQKYLQLTSIKNQLNLDIKIEMGTDFATSDEKVVQKSKERAKKLQIKFSDGEIIEDYNPIDTFLKTIRKIGVEEILRKEIEYARKPLITLAKQYNGQVEVENKRWVVVPPQTKDKAKMLRVINSIMRSGLEISII